MVYSFKVISLGLLFSVGLTACNATSPVQNDKGYETYITQGEQFKHTELIDINGNTVNMTADNKLVILFATWCSDSRRLLTELKSSTLLNNDKLTIVAIGREEDQQKLSEFNNEMQLPIHFVADPDRKIYSTYANKGIPRVIVLNKQNQVLQTLIGEQPDTLQQINWQ
ncbi:TlpA family protein disulfide reductase [Pseudoalteromonas sp. T1lg65]|uniref:TlpA family protein disulfide reductase n=1 Tax=Pseudoalteromonas sp. T1lg65 TaxID=2077101 RepID=UPI003F794FA1